MRTFGKGRTVSRILSKNSFASAYKAYYDRNEVEYAFNLYKQILSGNRWRLSSNEALEGKAFVQFIATSIAIMLRRRISNALKDTKIKLPYDSEKALIDKLDSIILTKFEFGSYYSVVVGGLKEILTAMKIPIPTESPDNQNIDEDDFCDDFDEAEYEIQSVEELSDFSRLS
ncbi:hypothetical protein [uncultured Succinivibrio sp.]|uniref:hypothetical protein n=1 Tax=uncultured Succinivibrio sp. TaxID=540749 RepID=UPI0025DDC66A|nr:hypothetical protein [uncultured Succinivibrio sp.]